MDTPIILYAHCLLLASSLLVSPLRGQEAAFAPPFDTPLTFSGNFGEIRANHFHGGLDFKTGGETGRPVRALADGYISRIRVTHGSGYVLDVAYANGYTTINRHLSAFVGEIARRVEGLQYETESWEVEIVPGPGEYPVRTGQVIALSGNTGYSFGPHLHLDVLETATGESVDPLPFFKSKVKDRVAPRAEGFALFPQPGLGVVDNLQQPVKIPLQPSKEIAAWGLVGAGIRAYDYMDGVPNRYGVHTVVLEVDGEEVFRSTVNRFSDQENRYINSWTYGQYMKSFIDPGNKLRMLQSAGENRGLVWINEERPYRFAYTLSDALGNTSHYAFTVQGRKTAVPAVDYKGRHALKWDQVNVIQEPGLELVIPKGRLYSDVWLDYAADVDSGDIAYTYRLHAGRVPLHRYCDMRIGLRRLPVADTTKYYVAGVNPNGRKYYVGGTYENGYMKVRIRELAAYTVAVDTVPPAIIPLQPARWGRDGRIVFQVKDKGSGLAAYRGVIDGKYALFGKPNSVSGNLVCELDPKHVKKGGMHRVALTVTDACGNQATEYVDFRW